MEIQEDSSDEIKKNKIETSNLSLRKPKTNPKITQINNNIDIYNNEKTFNELLPGEIELNNEELVFTNKKRQRGNNLTIINLNNDNNHSNINIVKKIVSDEEKLLSQKALEIYKELNIPPTQGLKENEYDWLKRKLKEEGIIISLLDFDATGRMGADYLRNNYNIPYLFITRGELGLPNYNGKDFADLHDYFNSNQINQFIKETIEYVEIKYRANGIYYSDADRPYL